MNILLVNHYAGSMTHGMEYRPYYLARQWVRQGHEVTIAAASFSHLRTAAPAIGGGVTEEWIDGIRYLWLKTPEYQGNGVRRAVNMFAFEWQLQRHCGRLVRDCSPEIVIASSPHPLIIYSCVRIARMARARLVFEVRDIWPLTLVELGGLSARHPFAVLLQAAEKSAYRRADRVVSLLPKADEHMRRHGMAAGKFAYVPTGIDVAQWEADASPLPTEHARALARLKLEGRLLVGYAGAHGISNALGVLLDAARLLEDRPFGFVLVGQGPEKERLRARAELRAAGHVVFLPPVPKTALPALLAGMDILYLGWNRNRLYRFGISPNKLFDYMMASKPVVHAVEAGNDLVAESGCGISCPPDDPAAVADAIRDLLGRPRLELQAMGRCARDYVVRHYDYSMLARQFLESVR